MPEIEMMISNDSFVLLMREEREGWTIRMISERDVVRRCLGKGKWQGASETNGRGSGYNYYQVCLRCVPASEPIG